MERRSFLKSAMLGSSAVLMGSPLLKVHAAFTSAAASSSSMKITKINTIALPDTINHCLTRHVV